MKKVFVIAAHRRFEEDSAFRIRLLAMREAMSRRGFAFEIGVRPKMPWGRMALARSAEGCHAVILQRKMLDPYEAKMLRRSIGGSGRIVMDIDDATMYHETEIGGLTRRRLERRFAATAAILDGVCAGNEYLADIFRRQGVKNVRIVPSVVAPSEYPVKKHGSVTEPRLVWIGSSSTLKYLEQAYGGIAQAARRVKGLKLVVIADRKPEGDCGAPVELVQWSVDGEKEALLRGEIGIAPTPEDRWTLGKCGFKIVQYMAAGLPVVASPVGANVELVGEGAGACGLLANSDEEWGDAIVRLVEDAALRGRMGRVGRERVERELCVEKMANLWAEVLG